MFAQQAHGEAPLGGAAASRRQHPQELQLPQPTHSSSHPPRSTSPCLDSRSRRTKGTRNNNSGVDQRIFPAGADLLASHNFDFPTSEVLSVEDLWATIEPYLFAVYSSLHAQGLDASQSARITRNHMLCYTCVYNACDGSPGKCREIYVRLAACVLRALEVLVLYPILRRLTAADEALDIQTTTTTSAAVAKTASLGEVSGGAADAASARRGGAPSQPSSALLRSATHSRGQEDRDADMFRSERRRLEAESEMLGEGSSPLIGPIASPKISPPPMAPLAATPSTSSLSLSATTTTNASPNFFLCRAFVDEYRIFAHFLRFVSSCFRYLDHYTNQCRVESITTMCVKLFCVAVYEPLRPLLWKEMSSLFTEARMCYSRRETVDDGQLELIKAAVSAISELMALAHHTRSQQLLSEDNNNNNTSPPLISVLPMAEGATATQQTTATPSVMASAAASLRASVGGGSGHFFSRRSTTSPGKKQRVPTQASDHDLVQQHRSPLHTSELDSSPLVAESSAARIFLRAQKPREWLRSLVSAVGSSMSSSIFDAPPAVRSSRERAASTPMAMPSSSEWIHGTTTSAPHNTSSRGHHPACVPECSSSAKLDSPHPHSPRSRSASPSTPLLAAASPTKEGTIDLVEMVHLRQRLDGRAAVEALARHSRELGSCDGGACATTSDVEGDPDARNGNTSLNASTYYDSAVAEAAAAAAAAANAAAPMVGSIIFAVEGSLTELAMATYGSKYMEVATSFYEVEREEQRRSAQGRRGYFAWLRRVWCVENLFLSGVLPRVPTFFEQLRSTLAQLLVVEPHRSLILDRDAGFLALLEVWDGRPDEDGLVDAIVGNRDRYHLIHPVLRGFSIQTRGEKEKEGQAAHTCPATPQLVPTTTRCTREAAAEANNTATAHDGAAARYADKDGEEARDEHQRPTHAHICRAVEIFHLVFKETSPDSLLLLACVLATKFIRDAAAILDEFWIEPFTRCTTHINGAMVQGWSRKLLPHMIMLHQRYAELVREVLEQAPLFQAAITDALGEVLNPTRWSKAGAMAATEWRAKGSTMMFGLPSVLLSRDAGARATAPLAAFATHAHVAVAALQVGSFLASYAEHALQHLPATLAAIRAVELKMNRNTKNDGGDGAVGMKEDDEEEEHRVWRQLALFASLLDHQDKFLEPYTRRLHRRLLVERVDFPREQMLVQHLQSALGVATTQRLGAMLRDGEATCALQSRLDFDPTFAHLPAPLQVHVMAAPNWPTTAGGVERGEGGGAGRRSATYMFAPMTGAFPILPPAFVPHTSLVEGLRLVEAHYAALHPWRRLTWAHGAGWAMMELHYPQATMEVRTNIIQGTILLHVSEACNPPACASLAQKKMRGIRAKELAARMHLPFDQILKHLDSLMRTPSCQLIRRQSESGTEREGDDAEVRVQPQDVFVLNACFAHRHKQWSIPAPPRTASTEKEQSGSPRREPQMDASIMFALKQQSAGMRVQELHANVEQQLSAFCAPSMRELRMSLERLLDRGYVRRKESDAGLYCYVP